MLAMIRNLILINCEFHECTTLALKYSLFVTHVGNVRQVLGIEPYKCINDKCINNIYIYVYKIKEKILLIQNSTTKNTQKIEAQKDPTNCLSHQAKTQPTYGNNLNLSQQVRSPCCHCISLSKLFSLLSISHIRLHSISIAL